MDILIVEDDIGITDLLEEKLESRGYQVISLHTASEALAYLEIYSPELLVLDYGLPDMNGRAFIAELQQRANSLPPFIVATGQGDERVAVEMMKLGARDYVVKDFHFLDVLPEIIRRVDQEIKNEYKLKRAEDAWRESEARFRAAFLISPDSININRMSDGLYIEVNEGFLRILGYERDEVIGRTSMELDIWDDPKDRQHLVEKLSANGYVENLEANFRRKDGSIRIGLMSARTITLNEELCIISITRDITERKRIQQEKEKLQAELLQSQKMESLGQLAGGIAHDFNNILVPIIGYAELGMMKLSPEDDLYADLEHIIDAADRAAAIIRQILAFSRKQVLDVRPLDLNQVVLDFKKMMQRLIGEDILVKTVLAPSLNMVQADPAQIEQVLLNLTVNARDAMPQGGQLTIETDNVFLDNPYTQQHLDIEPGPYVMLSVSDTGVGMDTETAQRVFEPFFTTKPQGKGTGLGLATVFGIVKQHNGNIWLYSEPGHGTTIKIYLPPAQETLSDILDLSALTDSVNGTETILVVEDEIMVRQLACKALCARGYLVLEATSPAEGLRLAQEYPHPIHLLLTDVIMPHMNGRQLYEQIIMVRPEIKVLYMSGYTDNVVVHHGMLDEGINFLQKPFTVYNLTKKVKEALN